LKILITGATGFIGKNFVKAITKNQKYKIAIIVRKKLPKKNDLNQLKNLKIFISNLDDFHRLDKIFNDFKPSIIYHFAWSGVANFERNKNEQIINLVYSSNLALLSSKYNIKKFIGLGSQAEYGPQNKKLSENSIAQPSTLYGKMKLNTYLTLANHFKETKIKFIWLRLFSCFGPGDHDYWFINYLILTLLDNKDANITKCEQKWDYIYIDDLVSLLIKFITKKTSSNLYNVGSGNVLKLKNIVKFIQKNIDSKGVINFGAVPYRSDQVMKLIPDVSLLKSDLNWKPKNSTYDGILKTINWYKNKNEYN